MWGYEPRMRRGFCICAGGKHAGGVTDVEALYFTGVGDEAVTPMHTCNECR